jgi:hypothetical protein
VTASRNAPTLQTISITVPRSLRVAARHGVSVMTMSAKPQGLPFIDHASAQSTLTIALRQTEKSIRVRLAPPSLSARRGRLPASLVGGRNRLVLILQVTDASFGRSELTAKIAVS